MASLRKQATKLAPKGLFLLVLGPSKAGKSHLMGTMPGKGNTLLLHGQGEKHGVKSAFKGQENKLIPVQWPASDDLIKWFKTVLTPAQIKEDNITCIGVDSLTDLFRDIRNTKTFQNKCQTASGKHNSFAEATALIDLMSLILGYLEKLRTETGVQVICSMHATVTFQENGNPAEVKPDLPTFGVAAFLVRYFGDILVMNDRKILTGVKATRESKDETGKAVKFLDFRPCLDDVMELPAEIEPSIAALLKLKGVSTDG